jgi:hypothetical protein
MKDPEIRRSAEQDDLTYRQVPMLDDQADVACWLYGLVGAVLGALVMWVAMGGPWQ